MKHHYICGGCFIEFRSSKKHLKFCSQKCYLTNCPPMKGRSRPDVITRNKTFKSRYWQGKKRPEMQGKNNYFWNGGRYVSRGYIMVHNPKHPNANKKGYVLEHRLVMEESIGRYLTKIERIHHINGNKQDNRIENLKLFSSESEHQKHHRELERCARQAYI